MMIKVLGKLQAREVGSTLVVVRRTMSVRSNLEINRHRSLEVATTMRCDENRERNYRGGVTSCKFRETLYTGRRIIN